MSSLTRKPIVLTFDDDVDINKAVTLFLNHIGFQTVTTTTPELFQSKLQTICPDVCLIDIMYKNQPVGFDLVKMVRDKYKNKVPIIVMSGNSDLFTVTHTIELGANDFIMKPIDKDLLISKVSRFAASGDLVENKYPSAFLPQEGEPGIMTIEMDAFEVDEFGITIKSPHVITKGSVLQISGPLIWDITGNQNTLLMTISNTWLLPNSIQIFAAYAEFDNTNDALMTSVRKWLTKMVK